MLRRASRGLSVGQSVSFIRLLMPLPGSPYQVLQFSAQTGDLGGSFGAVTYRYDEGSNSNQTYIWQHHARTSALHVAANDRHARLLLASDLATATLRFDTGQQTKGQVFDCSNPFYPGEQVRSTLGRFRGSLAFTPQQSMFDANATSLRAGVATLTKVRNCAVSRGRRCYSQRSFGFGDQFAASFSVSSFHGSQTVDAFRVFGSSPNYALEWIRWGPLGDPPLTRTGSQITVDASAAGPFLSGQIAFDAAGAPVTSRFGHCPAQTTAYTWSSGNVGLNFDVGAADLTGPGLGAQDLRIRHS